MQARRRASIVCVRRNRLLCVKLRDPRSRILRLFPPGGRIEAGETAAEAAQREALEETGYRVCVDEATESVARYPFPWDGQWLDVTTHFFRAQLQPPEQAPRPVHDASYHEGVCWLERSAVSQALGFQADILRAVLALWPDAP